MHQEPAHEVLGIPVNADKTTVKAAFRKLAMQCHPDRDSSVEAARQFQRISKAADLLLHRGKGYDPQAAAQAASARQQWRQNHSRYNEPRWTLLVRQTRLPFILCSACLVAGCALFAGALHVHQGLYTFSTPQAAMERRSNPTEQQQRIQELLQERRDMTRMQRTDHDR